MDELIRAVIFDMDGLMLDTERLDREHFLRAAAEFGYSDLEDVYLQTAGWNRVDTKNRFLRILGPSFPFDELWERRRKHSRDHADEFGVPLKPGLQALLALLDRIGLRKAVATSTPRHDATVLLRRVSLLHHFEVVVGGDEVANGKPDPEIFLTAAQRLGVAPAGCVVFEDSPAGVRAAHAAHMVPIFVPDVCAPTPETIDLAYSVLQTLDEAPALLARITRSR